MAMTRKTRRMALVLTALAILAGLAAFDGWRLARVQSWNRAMADGSILAATGPLPPEVLFAQAYHRDRKGDHQAALDLYRRAAKQGDATLKAAAEYNSANLYLREGMALRVAETAVHALPLLELAKESYRHVLRDDSGHWDAKYNLERALRLAPEPEEGEAVDSGPPRDRDRAPATVRVFSYGLP